MITLGSFTVVLIAFFLPSQVIGDGVDQTPLLATCSPATTPRVYSVLVYINLISSHDPEYVFKIFPSDYAASQIYKMNLRLLTEFGLRNAKDIASRVAKAVSQADVFTISLYYQNTAFAVGEYLVGLGLLDCSNSVEWATEYFNFEQSRFEGLDPTQIESYMEAIVRSLGDLLDSLGYNLAEKEQGFQILADFFYKKYITYA